MVARWLTLALLIVPLQAESVSRSPAVRAEFRKLNPWLG